MSELLQLAKQLRSLTDEQLAELIRKRQVTANPSDFLDLAQQLLTPKSIEACLGTLTAKELDALRTLGQSSVESASILINSGLVFKRDEKIEILGSVSQLLRGLQPTEPPAIRRVSSESDLSGLAAIAAFETQLAITELLLDAEARLVRVVNKNSFGLPDVKSLSNQLHKGLDFARNCYQAARRLGLLRPSDSRWWLTSLAKKWLEAEPIERWEMLASDWVASLGSQAVFELKSTLSEDTELHSVLATVFPLADKSLSDRLSELANQAEWFGLAVAGRPTEALLLLLRAELSSAKASIAKHLPKPQRRLLAQGDQTLVATGPLPTDVEILVRTFAELEQVSLACTYRLTEQSLSYGLECGLTETDIRKTLIDLTSGALPQPIDYLIRQAATRFARIKIASGTGGERSIITATETVLLSELLNDQRLRAFAFAPRSANSIATRFEPEVTYFGLRENGFLAVRVDEKGQVISPKQSVSWRLDSGESTLDAATVLVKQLREVDARVGESPTDDDLLRQLQLAIKNRATIEVHLTLRDGKSQSYQLKVSGLANGRLRGLDAKADAERVLPLSQITRIEF